jgi:FAD/FMN-containing dehydrogenase
MTAVVSTLAGTTKTIDGRSLEGFRSGLSGSLLGQGDEGYNEARLIWNAMVAKKPALIARCRGTADVVRCVDFARQHGLLLSVKGGGHNISGTSLCEGGLTIDLSLMRGVFTDPEARTVRAQGGCLLGDVDRETQLRGLATVLGFVSETGVGGLTLGGGFGYLSRRFGYTVDNLLEVEIVTADGKIRRASREENADLFWAIRGGGGNFGVVTWFTYRLHPVGPKIMGGLIAWPSARAEEILRFYRAYTAKSSPELTLVAMVRRAPPAPFMPPEWHGKPIVAMVVCHTGDADQATKELMPIKDLGDPIVDLLRETTYVAQQSMLNATQPKGINYYWKTGYLASLPDEFLDTFRVQALKATSGLSQSIIFHLGEAIGSRVPDDGAVGNRDARYVCGAAAAWKEGPAEPHVAWARESWKAMQPLSTGGVYINFLTEEEGMDRVRAAYGNNYERLVKVKAMYDPENLFRTNKNIRPAA